MRLRVTGGLLVALLCAVSGIHAQIPGRNVNMVSGASWPDGDPMLQRQNEPSVAASTRNPLHLLAGSNDYRTVDIPGLPDGDETGDAWLGLYKSTDGGQRWTSNLLAGYPQDDSAIGMASPLKGYQAAADPVVRAGSNGLLYYSGLVFDRVDNGKSAIFVARFIDNNNQEAGDPIKYIGAVRVATHTGAGGVFLDKPWMAVDIPRTTARTCVINTPGEDGNIEQRLPAGTVYVAYSMVSEDALGPRSAIYLTSSTTCGSTWSTPQRLSRLTDRVNQGATIAIDPRNGRVHVTWRRFDLTGDNDAMMLASNSGPGQGFGLARIIRRFQSFGPGQRDIWRVFEHRIRRRHGQDTSVAAAPQNAGPPQVEGVSSWWHHLLPWLQWLLGGWRVNEVENIAPFDQGTSAIDLSFRTNAYPTLTIDGTGRLYMAWTERGFATHPDAGSVTDGDARIVMTTSTNGTTWTPPQAVAEYGQRGHQLMPSLAFAGGRLMLVYYDLIEDRSGVFTRFVDDLTSFQLAPNRRHTLDIRASMGTPGETPAFEPSVRVSDYMLGARSATGPIEQLQVNPPNLPMFRLGTAPFFGDYIDLAPAPSMVPNGSGGWLFNTDAGTTHPVFHAVWTDNRDVRAPTQDTNLDLNPWNDYIPPIFPGRPVQSRIDPAQTVGECTAANAGNAGSRNQNIYTARITGGLLVGSPGNTKPLSLDLQRAFVVFVHNTSGQTRSFRLTILNQPLDGRASFDQFPVPSSPPPFTPPLTVLDMTIGPRSSASRTVYVTSSDAHATINIDVAEIAMPGAPGEVPGGLEGRIILNPDLLNPEIENPEIENPEIENPEIENAEVYNPEIENPEIENPEIENPEIENPEIENPEIENPEIENIRIANPEIDNPEIENLVILNPEIENPEIENPEIENPEIENGTVTDITWKVTNNGNTTAAFNVNVFLQGQQASLPPGVVTQLIIYKVYKTPVVDQCDLKTITQNVLIANIPSPDIVTPGGGGFHDLNDPSVKNATLWLEPGGLVEVNILLRIFDPDRSNNIIIDGASIDPGVVPQEDVDLVLQQQSVNSEDAEDGVTEPPITTTTGSTIFFLTQPSSAVPAVPMTPEIQVQVRDTSGAPLPGVAVTLSLGANPTGAILSGGAAVTGPDGIAHFPALSINLTGVGYTLVATAAAPGVEPVTSLLFAVYEQCVASGVATVSRYHVDGPAVSDRPKFIQAGVDWTNDGREDVVVVTEGGVFYTKQNVLGGFQGSYIFASGTGPGSAAAVATGDFTSDGFADVVVAKGVANTIVLVPLVNGGPGSAPSTISVGDHAIGLVAGHFNADTFLDLAVARAASVRVLFGDGTGAFPVHTDIAGLSLATGVAAGDLDEDGDLDLIATDSPGPAGLGYPIRNDGGGVFALLMPVPLGNTPFSPAVHDFDHDGHLDFATADAGSGGGITVMFGDGSFAFPRAAIVGLGFVPSGLAAGDFDGNGTGDVAVANTAANALHIQLSRPGSPALFFDNPRSFATDPQPVSVAAGDFNGDGRADLATANRSVGSLDDFNTMSVLLGSCGALTADLEMRVDEDDDPVTAGAQVVHTAVVTNLGPFPATNVRLDLQAAVTDSGGTYLENVALVSSNFTQGTCTTGEFSGTLVAECQFGTIPSGGTASLALTYTAPAAGRVVFTGGSVVAAELDVNPATNLSSETTTAAAAGPASPISIDTTAVQPDSMFSVQDGVGAQVVPPTNTGGVTNVSLFPGTYTFRMPWASSTAFFEFEVTPAGVLALGPQLAGIASGAGTQTLVVTGRRVRVDTLSLRPGPAVGEDGDLFVGSADTNQILRYDGQTGAFVGVFAEHASMASPFGFVFGPDGHLFVADYFNSRIVKFDGQTGAFLGEFVAAGSGGLAFPTTLAFGPDGNLYAGSAAAYDVLRFNGQTGAFIDVFVSAGSGGLADPYDMKFGPDGRLYVAGLPTDSVFRYDGVTGAFVDRIGPGTGLQFPSVFAFGPDGHLYVSSEGGGPGIHGILRFNITTGAFIDVFVPGGSGGMTGVQGLSFGPDGHLYLSDAAGVLKYDGSAGAFIGTFVAEGSGGLGTALFNGFRSSAHPAPGTYSIYSDAATATGVEPSGSLREFAMLPGTYQFHAPYTSTTAVFDFSVTPAGTVDFAPALDAFVGGRGTSTLIVVGHPISIDTTAFDNQSSYAVFSNGGVAIGISQAGGVRTTGLLPGTYDFYMPFSSSSPFEFTVTAGGTIDFALALDPYVSGRGTSTLTVLGRVITIDTTAFTPDTHYIVWSGGAATGIVPAGSARPTTLLPGTYQFFMPFSTSTPFEFTVSAAGTIDFAPALDAYVSGRGTSTLTVLGRLITIDTTAFTPDTNYMVWSGGAATGIVSAGSAQPTRLLPGTYQFFMPFSTSTPFEFTVSAAGTIDFAPALDGYISGRGTSTLTVLGHTIDIDTSAFSGETMYTVWSGGAATGIVTAGGVVPTRLLPGTYQFYMPFSTPTPFEFTVDAGGLIDFAPALDGFVAGRGTSTLVVLGHAIAFDTSALSDWSTYMILGGGVAAGPLPAGGIVTRHLLPGTYTFSLPHTSPTTGFSFTVSATGTVDFAAALDGFLSGRGSSTLIVSGYPLAINTTPFSDWANYAVFSGGTAVGPTAAGGVVPARLLPGTYSFRLPFTTASAMFDFTVTAAGNIDFAPALDAYVGGRGTTTLVVTGFSVNIDTTALGTGSQFTILSAAPATGPLATGSIEAVVLLPGNYVFDGPFDFAFSVLTNGTLTFSAAFEPDVTGNGTATLTIHNDPNTDADDLFDVTNTNDSGVGSLRQAILNANVNPDANTVRFFIPGVVVHTITPLTPLPTISTRMQIDGRTQAGYAGAPVIELNGASAGILANGLNITGGNTIVRALVINRFIASGILMTGGGFNLVSGSYIGTDVTGTIDLGNGGAGIGIGPGSDGHVIGLVGPSGGNVISGNAGDGINIVNATGHVIRNNIIGLNAAGTADLGNSQAGIEVGGLSGADIGGVSAGWGNLISGNNADGVFVQGPGAPSSPAVVVEGNIIGLDAAGTNVIGNGGAGVRTLNAAVRVGSTSGVRNVISGNGNGITFSNSGSTFFSLVQGNYIGTDITGTIARGAGIGVVIASSPGTIVGGQNPGEGNLISGQQTGVSIGSISHPVIGGLYNAVVQGNLIGVNAAGTAALANNTGVLIANANNLIGGASAGARNVISGNNANGVSVLATGAGTRIEGNYIGTSAGGTAAVPNLGIAVRVLAPTVIGGVTAGAGNVISGNSATAIRVEPGAGGTTIEGNRLGTDVSGTVALPNAGPGIFVDQAPVAIGGAVAGAGNVVSGNNTDGVILNAVAGFTVLGNRIGTSADGSFAIPNTGSGIGLVGGSGTIGGNTAAARNVISGNLFAGVRVDGGDGVVIEGNYIGLDAAGNTALGNQMGVDINGGPGATTNVDVESNVISGNGNGVLARGGNNNRIQNNLIGTNFDGTAAVPNTANGVHLTSGPGMAATSYLVSANTIAFNGGDGVGVTAAATQNVIASRIHLNDGQGIALGVDGVTANDALDADAGPNGLQNYPVLSTVAVSTTDTTVTGTLQSTPNSSFTVRVYSIPALDASGFGEGNVQFGAFTVNTDALGNAPFSQVVPTAIPITHYVVATATGSDGTSEFSAGIPVSGFFVVNTNDSGAGSLRAAITNTNTAPGAQFIKFNIPGAGPHTIGVIAELPIIGDNVTIDGTSQPGYVGLPMVIVDGSSTPAGSSGFRLEGNGSIVSGLSVMNFGTAYGFLVRGTGNRVLSNLVGLDPNNVSGPNHIGVYAAYATTPLIANNTIGASNSDGVLLAGGIDPTVEHNVIGLTPDKTTSRGNSGNGITMYDGSQDTIIRGNTIASNLGWGIDLQQTGALAPVNETRIIANVIGLGAGGVAMGNLGGGVRVDNAPDTTIGENGAGNVISGNGGVGPVIGVGIEVVRSAVASMPVILSNFIGTDPTGELVRSNNNKGISLLGPAQVGGTGDGDGNLLSGNGDVMGGAGIIVGLDAGGSVIQGNTIGLSASGAVLGNGYSGITVRSTSTITIGGTTAGARNVISGNGVFGISILRIVVADPEPSGTIVQGNYIGTDPTGTVSRANTSAGISVSGTNHVIGGTAAGEGNLIAFNGAQGLRIFGSASGVRVRANSIRDNGGLGIDLNDDGVTANDMNDTDVGPNDLQNYPVLTSAVNVGGDTVVSGTLQATPAGVYTIDFYASASAACGDPSGFGEGPVYRGSVVVMETGGGLAGIGATLPGNTPAGFRITATATNSLGSTSEFSACVTVP